MKLSATHQPTPGASERHTGYWCALSSDSLSLATRTTFVGLRGQKLIQVGENPGGQGG